MSLMQILASIALIILAFAGLWAGMELWSAHAFGWSSLARAYRLRGSFAGQVWRLQDCHLVRMRWAGFERSLNAFFPLLPRDVPDEVFGAEDHELDVGATPEGLYLAVSPAKGVLGRKVRGKVLRVLQVWHPPLFIPWSDIAVSAESIHWINELIGVRLSILRRGRRAANGWIDCLMFRFRRAPGVLLQLREEQARPLIAAAGSSWPGLVQSQSISTPP
jgi:hypothetical protein